MERVIQVARETGYLDGVGDFRGTDVYGYLPPEKVLALCTGSQGEPRAALARIALDEHPDVSLAKGDRVIFSSRTIPGNEKPVGRIVNGLVRQGVEVISDRTHLVHVSGHPRRAELADMFSWVKPRIAIPVHGEALHLAEHAALARSLGVPATIVCQNGDLIKLAPEPAGIIDEVPAARLYKDGKLVVEAAGGGVGTLLVQIARRAGARVVALASQPRKLALARDLGADVTVDYSRDGWERQVHDAVGEVDVVFDGVGGDIGLAAFGLLRAGGRFCPFGMSSGRFASVTPELAQDRQVIVQAGAGGSPEHLAALARMALAEAGAGRLRPVVGQEFELADAARAHAAIEARETVGKTLLTVPR